LYRKIAIVSSSSDGSPEGFHALKKVNGESLKKFKITRHLIVTGHNQSLTSFSELPVKLGPVICNAAKRGTEYYFMLSENSRNSLIRIWQMSTMLVGRPRLVHLPRSRIDDLKLRPCSYLLPSPRSSGFDLAQAQEGAFSVDRNRQSQQDQDP
jgi:hypothetical protein